MLTLLRHRRKSLRAAAAADYRSTVLADSPSVYWQLDESSGTTLADSAGSYNLTLTGSYSLNQSSLAGASASVDYTGGHAAGADQGPDLSSTDYTLELVTKLDSTQASWAGLISSGGSTANDWAVQRFSSTGDLRVYHGSTSQTFSGGFSSIADDSSHHIVITYINSSKIMELWIDGVSQGTVTHSNHPTNKAGYTLRLAASRDPIASSGLFDEAAIYTSKLSDARISAHYNAVTAPNDNFEFTVQTTGTNETFTIPCTNHGTFDAVVDWGDSSTSTITAYNDADLTHTYSSAGTHSISISGTFGNIRFVNSSDKTKVRTVTNLGSVGWTRFNAAFQGCTGLTSFTAGDCDTSSVTNWQRMFRGCTNMTTCNMDGMSTASATQFHSMFYDCSSLTAIDCSGFDVSNVTSFGFGMFYNCNVATSISVSNWNVTSGCTYFAGMFQNCQSVTSLDLSGWDTSGVTSMQNMFYRCFNADIDITGWTSVGVTDMNYFIYRVNQSNNVIVGLSGLNVESIAATPTEFADGVTLSTAEYDSILIAWSAQTVVSGQTWDFGSSQYTANSTAATARADLVTAGWTITDGGSIANNNFEFTVRTTGSSELVDLTQMTWYLSSYNATIDWGDGSATSTVTAYNDADLAHTYSTAGDYSISISGTFGTVYTSGTSQLGYGNTLRSQIISVQNVGSLNYTDADYSWDGCTNLTTFNFGNVDYSGISSSGLRSYFQGCTSLTSINFGDLDTSSVTSMGSMFLNCSSLTSIDLSSFDTSSVTDISTMFRDCSSLTSVDLSSFDTSSVTSMATMFYGCSSLTSVDLSSFDTSNVINMRNMFNGISSSSQATITGIEDFDITSLSTNRATNILANSSLSTTVYDELLVNWQAQTGYNAQNPNFGGSKYTASSAAATARAALVTAGWNITDGGTVPAGDAIILNGYSGTTTGGVESDILTDGSSTVYGGYATGAMQFRDATSDGTWADDGFGLLWDHSTDATNWVALIGTTAGTFNVYQQGTTTLIYSLAWTGTAGFTANFDRYGTTSVDFTGTVPANNTRVDVYHIQS
jgi:surface protein